MNQLLQYYSKYNIDGEWHIHTNYTDGKNSVSDYCETAVKLGIPLIAFTEHIRRIPSYNFYDLYNDILMARKKFSKLIILIGVEAKVLANGSIDCDEDILKMCDYNLFAYHSFPTDINLYKNSLETILLNYNVHCWAHPGLYFKKNNRIRIENEYISGIFSQMKNKEKIIEYNFKYQLPEINWLKEYLKFNSIIVFGGDIHSVEEMENVHNMKQRYIDYTNRAKKDIYGDIEKIILNMYKK